MTIDVLLDDIAGLGAPVTFGPAWYQTTFASCAVSANERVAYFGRTASYDPEMRNLVVASLGNSGNLVGIPQCYSTSAEPLAPISGYPAAALSQTTITALLVNCAKSRLYIAESRSTSAVDPPPSGLNVYTLDADGKPTGPVRTYAVGSMPGGGYSQALVMHPTLPVLYIGGWGMAAVSVQELDSSGDPTGVPTPYSMGGYGKFSIGISTDAKYLYMGTYPDVLEVVGLDSKGNPTGTFNSYTVSNAEVGAVSDYLRFKMGTRAIYMVRPNPSGSGLPILALWPLDSATGQPTGSALARTDINPPLVGASAMTIAVDDMNSRLWVANPTTFADAFTNATTVSGITPTSYVINGDGTLGAGKASASFSQLSNVAVLVPTSSSANPLFFNASAATAGNLVKGYQCRITVTAATTSSFPLTMNVTEAATGASIGSPSAALNTPSAWMGLDSVLKDKNYLVAIAVSTASPLLSMTIQLDLADSTGLILKSVTESVLSDSTAFKAELYIRAGFLLPGYSMGVDALTGSVSGMQTFSERSADYLSAANRNPVAAADRPKQIITDCFSILGGEANNALLTNLAQAMQAVGFNTVDAYWFDGLGAGNINKVLNDNGLPNRTGGSYVVGSYGAYAGGYFSFDVLNGMTPANLANWASDLVTQVAANNGGSPSQIVAVHMVDEPAWYYPSWFDYVGDPVNYPPGNIQWPCLELPVFQLYLQQQGSKHGFTYADLGGTSWSSLRPTGQSVGNPLTGGPATIENRRLYYWSIRFYADSAVEGMKMGQQAVTTAVGHPVATGVNWNNWIDLWYQASPNAKIGNNPVVNADSAMGLMDWMLAGRTSAHTAWTEDWFSDTQANRWSVYAAAMRSSTQAGTQGLGGYVVGPSMSQMPTGGRYRIFPLLGSGAKNYCGYAFGPEFLFPGNCWSELSSALVNGITRGDVYSEYADANRLIGRSESILYPGVAERSTVAILLPSASSLWDTQDQPPYYALELFGLYYAISHGYNITVDFVDDAAIENGALTDNDYFVLYVVGPNVSARAQVVITDWIKTWGPHNRQLVLVAGAGVADEYNTPTTLFDTLAGLVAGSRSASRDPVLNNHPYDDRYTATVKNINTAFYFKGKTMNIRGPFQALAPVSGPAGPSWTDQVYTTTSPVNQPGCMTKEYRGSGVSNFVTAFGFFPGYQYSSSPNTRYTNQLPQAWSIMAREIAIMPLIRQEPPRTVHIYNGKGPAGETLTAHNEYLTTCPVEALRVNVSGLGSPTAIAVVLLNWGGTQFPDLKFKVLGGIASPTTFKLASGEPLTGTSSTGGINSATMTLNDVDVVLISK